MLAAEALGAVGRARRASPLTPIAEALAAFGARADVRRALKLAELDMRHGIDARMGATIVRGLDDEALLHAAEFARRAGLNDRAINIAERTAARHDFGLRYLMPYRSEFEAAAREQDVDIALLFAHRAPGIALHPGHRVVGGRAGPDAADAGHRALGREAAGAGRDTGRRRSPISTLNTRSARSISATGSSDSISQPALAAAAYNAGPGRAQAWRPLTPLEGAAWVETIPFNETRDYVKKVLANAMFYTRALGKPAVPLTCGSAS